MCPSTSPVNTCNYYTDDIVFTSEQYCLVRDGHGSYWAIDQLGGPISPVNISTRIQICQPTDFFDPATGCSATPTQFGISGGVSGLATGNSVVLQNNSGDDQSVSADGPFSFNPLDDGSDYDVTVLTQPTTPNQTCSLTNESGTLVGANVTDVKVTCVTDSFTVGGTVAGLNGAGLVLQNNNGDDLPVNADGSFIFPTALLDENTYTVSILAQPTTASQTCSMANESGTLAGADVTDVSVSCIDDVIVPATNGRPHSIPTLSVWGLGLLTLLLGFVARRRPR